MKYNKETPVHITARESDYMMLAYDEYCSLGESMKYIRDEYLANKKRTDSRNLIHFTVRTKDDSRDIYILNVYNGIGGGIESLCEMTAAELEELVEYKNYIH